MNIKELVETHHKGEYIDTDLYGLAEQLHCLTSNSHWSSEYKQLTTRLYKRVIKNHSYDGRRIWYLAIIVFDNIEVAVLQKAGREGEDHSKVLIVDKDKYIDACRYLDSLVASELYDVPDAISNETVIDEFYGQSLSEPFERY